MLGVGQALSLAGALLLLQATSAAAEGDSCGYINGYHYAGQMTGLDNTYTQCGTTREYGGWNGIDGQMQVPSSLATLGNYQTDHAVGLFSAQLANDNFWVQPGWYTGEICGSNCGNCQYPSCTWRGISYGWYIENKSPAGYKVQDFGYAAFNSTRTVYMKYNANDGCWEVQLDYGGPINWYDCSEYPYISGAMFAANEIDVNSGVTGGLPTSYFGTSNPNTNQALRLHGGNGWVPWTANLSSYYTDRFDEYNTTPKYTNLTLDSFWYFENYLHS